MKPDPRAVDVRVTTKALEVTLADGRCICTPIAWFPRLARASVRDRARWELLGDGIGIHWPVIDEDLSVAGLLHGSSAPSASKTSRRYKGANGASGSMLVRDSWSRSYGTKRSKQAKSGKRSKT